MGTAVDNVEVIILSDDDEDENKQDESCAEASVLIVEMQDDKKSGNTFIYVVHCLCAGRVEVMNNVFI